MSQGAPSGAPGAGFCPFVRIDFIRKSVMKKLVLSSMALTMLAGHAHAQSSVTLSGTIYGGLGLNSGGVKSNTTAAGTSSFMLSGKEDIGGGSAVL